MRKIRADVAKCSNSCAANNTWYHSRYEHVLAKLCFRNAAVDVAIFD
jgi:hypothetical protein